jgi:choline dehydrogenase
LGYDYIVIGGGSAGSVVAARLAEDRSAKVLLLEAGGNNRSPLVSTPAACAKTSLNPCAQNWMFKTEPEPFLDNRVIDCPRGRGLGGSGAINGMVYIRGARQDYDQWRQMGLSGWGYEDVLPYFRKLENHERGEGPFHGASGPIRVTRTSDPNPIYDAIVAAGQQAGYPVTDDFNGPQQEGFGRYDCNIWRGQRSGPGSAYLSKPPANLTIRTDTRTTRLVIEKGRVTGVEVIGKGGQREVIEADREVILSAGAIQSPHILHLSGVGDAELLAAAGVKAVHELKGVGANLQDHLDVPIGYSCPLPITIYSRTRGLKGLGVGLEYLLFRKGIIGQGVAQLGGFVKSRPDLDRPDTQFCLITAAFDEGKLVDGFMWRPAHLAPESRGRVDLRSADPLEAPKIQFNYMSTDNDRLAMRGLVKFVREVMAQPAIGPYLGAELQPGKAVRTDAEIDAWVRQNALSDYHPVGTCRMGVAGDPLAVVDDQLKVFGLEGLRIADASVMPVIPSGNTNAPSMMVGEKCADMIRSGAALAKAA